MRRRLLLAAGALGAVVAVAVAATSFFVPDASSAPVLGLVRPERAALAPQDPDCGSQVDSPSEERSWRRQWSVRGHMSGMKGSFRAIDAGNDRAVVVWRTQRWHKAKMPQTVDGYFSADDVAADLDIFGSGDVPFGLGFELLGSDAAHLCAFHVTAPLEGGSVTISFPLTTSIPWTDLDVRERVESSTRFGERVAIERNGRFTCTIEVAGESRAPNYLRVARLAIQTNQRRPPWDTLTIDVEIEGLVFGARGRLELREP